MSERPWIVTLTDVQQRVLADYLLRNTILPWSEDCLRARTPRTLNLFEMKPFDVRIIYDGLKSHANTFRGKPNAYWKRIVAEFDKNIAAFRKFIEADAVERLSWVSADAVLDEAGEDA